ncbi:MAG: restriction endonuclease [Candidatus Electronema sp. V4]|uniref:restriction endonuclease n=1 Tax=Candidatus Electronema sp. V4 TaxID=3454756 RepID=UPI00405552FC
MAQERDREKLERVRIKEEELAEKKRKTQKIEAVKKELYALFRLEDQPQKRGKQLEHVLNALFSAYEILIKGDFKRVDPEGAGVIEQIDGVIEFSGHIYLVEMKLVNEPIGVEKIAQHVTRLFSRDAARGLFISSNGYANTTITECRIALSKKTMALVSLQEIVNLLERQGDLVEMLRKKIEAAIVGKNPYLEILS